MAPLQLGASPTPDAGSPASTADLSGPDGAFEMTLGALFSTSPLPLPGATPARPATSTEGDELTLVLGEDWSLDSTESTGEDDGASQPGLPAADKPDPTGGLTLERDLEIWLSRVGRRAATPQHDGPDRLLFAEDAEALIGSRVPSDARSRAMEHLWAPPPEADAVALGRLDFRPDPAADRTPRSGSSETSGRPGPHHPAGAMADEVDAETLLRELGPVANAVEIGGFGFPTMDRFPPAIAAEDSRRADAPAAAPHVRRIDAPPPGPELRVGLLAALHQRESHGVRNPATQAAAPGGAEGAATVVEAEPEGTAGDSPASAQRHDRSPVPPPGPRRDSAGWATVASFGPERAGPEPVSAPPSADARPANRRPDQVWRAERWSVPEPQSERSPSLPAIAGADPPANSRSSALVPDRGGSAGETPAARTVSQVITPAAVARRPDRVTIDLHDDLGEVGRLRISFRGPSLRATIIPAEPALAARLEQELPGLHRSLEERGMVDARVRIQPPGDPGAATGGGSAEPRGPDRQAPGEGRRESPGHEGGQRRQGRPRERPTPEQEQPGRWA